MPKRSHFFQPGDKSAIQTTMEAFLVDTVGLKADPAAAVLKHMADQYDIEVLEDLVHLSEKDMENVIEACGLKRVSAGKLMMVLKLI